MLDASTAGIVISTNRIVLRPFTPNDAADVFDAITLGLTRFMGWEPPASRAAFAQVWGTWLAPSTTAKELHLVIRSERSGEFFGLAGLHGIANVQPELGIWIKEASHGHGYGREAVAAVVAWSSRRFNIRTFLYPVAETNVASRRLAEALNGVVVGSSNRLKFAEVRYRIPAPRHALAGVHSVPYTDPICLA